ncbi:MAG: hypothetical protein IPN14_17085 [Bacteroidetes bacterium]|nr:hypothetical protein [Bacteroidota bacterium]
MKKRIFEEHDNNHDNILNQIHAEKDAKVNLLQSNLKLVNEAASALIHQYESKVREHSRYELNNKVPIWLGWIVIFVLAIAEGPLNAQVFEFFKLGSKETLITASLVIIIFPLLAHFTGVGLHKDTRGKINYKTVISLMFIILIFCFAINAFRVDYLETREHLGEVDYVKPSAISLMVTTQFAFAFILNISLFVGGILISYFMHDTDADFEKTVKNYRSNYPKLQKMQLN